MIEPNEYEGDEFVVIKDEQDNNYEDYEQICFDILYKCTYCHREFVEEDLHADHELECISQIRSRKRKTSTEICEDPLKMQILLNQGNMRFHIEESHSDDEEIVEDNQYGSSSNDEWNPNETEDPDTKNDDFNIEAESEEIEDSDLEESDEDKSFLCHLCNVHLPISEYKRHFMNHPKFSKFDRNFTEVTIEECIVEVTSVEDES